MDGRMTGWRISSKNPREREGERGLHEDSSAGCRRDIYETTANRTLVRLHRDIVT